MSNWTVLIAVHAVSASFALLFGAFQLLRRVRGDGVHRIIGRVWVASMYLVCLTSFGVQSLTGGFSWLHGLSVLTLVTVTTGLVAAVRGRIDSHKAFMRGSYFGVLGAFAGVVSVPTRRIPELAVYNLPVLVMWIAGIVMVVFGVIGLVKWSQSRNRQLQEQNG